MKKLLFLLLLSTNCFAAKWECISSLGFCHTWRMQVPTGWIVSGDNSTTDHQTYAMTFVPDPEHKWKV